MFPLKGISVDEDEPNLQWKTEMEGIGLAEAGLRL